MNPRCVFIPYRLLAQSALYLSAGVVVVFSLLVLIALLGWENGRQALPVFVPAADSGFLTWAAAFISGLCILLVGCYALALPWLPDTRQEGVTLHSGKGEVTIHLTAIEEYLQREAVRIPGVNHLRLRATTQNGLVVFHTDAYVTGQFSVPEITSELQAFLDFESREVLGLEKTGPVHITIRRICNDTRPIQLPMLAHQSDQETVRRGRSGLI